MIRWSVLVAATAVVMAAAFVAGASVPMKTPKPPEEVKTDVVKPPVVVGQKTGYFNMAKVMREYKRAKTAVLRLNARKDRMAANLLGLKAMHADLQAIAKNATNEKVKEEIADELIRLARQIEDMERGINRILNNRASIIISEIYDEMHATVATMARENNLTAVLAYPDATTPQEMENPLIKELKLKPPALQPFYLDPSADYTDELLRRLNEKFRDSD